MATAQVGLSKKISVKTVLGMAISNVVILQKHPQFDKESGQLVCMTIMGIASGVKTGESEHGPWYALTGQFKATNPHTGQVYMSGKCFLPEVALDLLLGQVNQGNTVEFAFTIIAQLDEQSPVGWSYTAVPLLKQEHNPLEALEAKLDAKLLAAPKQEKINKKKD
jgi:hypothetical protein